jgi:hypothetical protein
VPAKCFYLHIKGASLDALNLLKIERLDVFRCHHLLFLLLLLLLRPLL